MVCSQGNPRAEQTATVERCRSEPNRWWQEIEEQRIHTSRLPVCAFLGVVCSGQIPSTLSELFDTVYRLDGHEDKVTASDRVASKDAATHDIGRAVFGEESVEVGLGKGFSSRS